jgi:hypothetical protein
MEPKTKQQILNEAKAYLTKTSKHLFVTADGYMYKIETFEEQGKLYYATIFMGNGKVIINVKEAVSDRQYAYAGSNTLGILKQELFPTYYKAKSLPYFKKMRGIIGDLMSAIKVDNLANTELAEKLKERLPELEMTK